MPVKSILSSIDKQIIQDAIAEELQAAHLYRQLANYMQRAGYFGAQGFFAGEAESEHKHADLHAQFLNDMGAVAEMPALLAVAARPASLADAIGAGLATEQALAGSYEAWYRKATSPITQQHLLQFLEIQRKSVGEFGDWLARIERAAGDECGLLIIDQELGAN